jgi:hypothetical protein
MSEPLALPPILLHPYYWRHQAQSIKTGCLEKHNIREVLEDSKKVLTSQYANDRLKFYKYQSHKQKKKSVFK